MPTSMKKIIANRKNCKKSTGPISNQGKLKSSLNSIKHGLYGEKIAIIGENPDEINNITERLVKELKPIGINQEIIVSKMVDLAIRLRRIPLKDIQRTSKQIKGKPEIWSNTLRTNHRVLVIYRKGKLRPIVITPEHRYVFRKKIDEALSKV